ncbi:hypothetical protein AAFA46_08460 [Oscillospiraceae bacterium WX1]
MMTKIDNTLGIEKLKAYADLLEENDLQIRRLEKLEAMEEPSLSQRARIRELRERLPVAIQMEQSRGATLRDLVDRLAGPKHRAVLRLRYLDLLTWPKVCEAVFEDRDDYELKRENYQRQTFRIHVEAVKQLDALLVRQDCR